MNRNDWERQVHGSNMNVTAKCIALVVGSFGNWTKDKTVEPGATKVAQYAGVTRNTANEYINAMVEQGWLKPKGTGLYNTTIYELCEAVADTTGILARTKRKMNPNSTAKLRRGPKQTVADTTEPVADTRDSQLPIAEQSVADTSGSNLPEPSKSNLEKNLNTSPAPSGPVDDEDTSNIKRNETMENNKDKQGPVDKSPVPLNDDVKKAYLPDFPISFKDEEDLFKLKRTTPFYVVDFEFEEANEVTPSGSNQESQIETDSGWDEIKPAGAIKRVDYESKSTYGGWLFYSPAAAQRARAKESVLAGEGW